MHSTSSKKEAKMDNVATFKTTREKSSKELVVVEEMTPEEALTMHTSVKKRGRGAIIEFVHAETPYKNYGGYYYQMKKLGVMPMNPRGSGSNGRQKPTSYTSNPLEERVQQLEEQLQNLNVSAGQRASKIAATAFDQLNYKSRKFIGDMIAKDLPSGRLSYKQELWLSGLERQFGVRD